MEAHYQLSDAGFAAAFADLSLDPILFTHEAHLRLAWIHLRQADPAAVSNLLCTQIPRYASHVGAPGKFHRTVTVAAVYAVAHFMQNDEATTFPAFLAAHPRLKTHFRELLATHYSFDIFASEKARVDYLPPDVLPF
ncbi:MAG: hypothetical protein KDC54_16355 [Lewinella sp.]|nr:hypothetical protein [Lewinella sp.]